MTDSTQHETDTTDWSYESPECTACGSHNIECIVVQCRDREIATGGDVVHDEFTAEGTVLHARCSSCGTVLHRSDALDVLRDGLGDGQYRSIIP